MRHLILLVLAALTAGCSVMRGEGSHIGILAGGGISKTRAVDKQTEDSVSADGGHGHVRVELTRQAIPEENDVVHVGVRLGSTMRAVSADDFGTYGEYDAEMELRDISLAPLLRIYAPVADSFRLYADGFIGYSLSFGSLDIRDEILQERGHVSDEGSAYFYGAGAGMEFGKDSGALVLGIEYAEYVTEAIEGIEFKTADVTGIVGWRMRF